MNDPVMTGFLVLLLVVIVSLGVWYVTAEHYEQLIRNLSKKHQDEKENLMEQIVGLEFSLGVYETPESEQI